MSKQNIPYSKQNIIKKDIKSFPEINKTSIIDYLNIYINEANIKNEIIKNIEHKDKAQFHAYLEIQENKLKKHRKELRQQMI